MLSIPKIVKMVSKLEGSKGALSLSGKPLNMLTKDTEMAQVIGRMKDPQLDVAYKAKSNYNVAAFRLRDGKEAVANGAVSLQNPGTAESIIKYRFNVGENGKILRANSFVDFGKQLDIDDTSIAISRRKGITSIKTRLGKAGGSASEFNDKEAIKLASRYTGVSESEIRGAYNEGLSFVQEAWKSIGQAISGAPKGPKIEENAFKVKTKSFGPDVFKKGTAGADETLTKLKKISTEDFDELGKIKKSDFGKIKQADISNIEDYLNPNPPKLKLGELEKFLTDELEWYKKYLKK